MRLMHVAGIVMPLIVFAGAPAGAAELDLLVPLGPDDPSPPPAGAAAMTGVAADCGPLASASGRVIRRRLVIRESDRPDVGPYTVALPGYGSDHPPGGHDSYRPLLIKASAGDSLRFDIVNRLAGAQHAGAPQAGAHATGSAVNLHTHGLVVSPRPCPPFGDYVFVENQPGSTTPYQIDIPATLPGSMFGSLTHDVPYPSGLNWFHSHLHGTAKQDVQAGQSGMLYIGDLLADLRAAPSLPAATADMLGRTDILYLGLRDIQLAVPHGVTPEHAKPGQRATWLHGADFKANACLTQANPQTGDAPLPSDPIGTPSTSAPGYCAHAGATVGGHLDPAQDTVWLFTINGQHDPTITLQPGRNQIWRIANLSSDVSYLIELVDEPTGTPQTLQVLSIDGLVAGTNPPGAPTAENVSLHVDVKVKRLLLMPAGRAEVFLPNVAKAGDRSYRLRTAGVTTGPNADSWPRIDLAGVVMRGRSPATASGFVAAAGSQDAVDTSSATLDVTLPGAAATSAPARTPAAAGAPRGFAAPPAALVDCVALPADGRVARRRITFASRIVTIPTAGGAQTREVFELGSEVVDRDGTVLDKHDSIGPQTFPIAAMTAPRSVRRICPRLGETEVWELVNTTPELHNFHLHQSKFRLARQDDDGAPPNMVAVTDPTRRIGQYVPEAERPDPNATATIWHDTLPVPPALFDAAGTLVTRGRTFVSIPIRARQQLGDFVYHCHILEHEDGGMMAVVQIFDPANP